MKPPEPIITESDRVQQIHSLATDAKTDPTARQQLADAALIHGLIYSNRLNTITLATIERIKEISLEALRELDFATQREARRRSRVASSASSEVER